MKGDDAQPWWGLNPRSLDFIPSSTNSCHVSDHQSNASHTYFYISWAPDKKKCTWKITKKYELKMSDDGHLEFYDLLENGVTYSLAYGRIGFSMKNSYGTNKWSTFPQNAYRSLSRAIFWFFLSWLIDSKPAMVQIKDWRQTCCKSLFESFIV